MLSYLFYVGILLPTVVTLALFVFFVICWRRQNARRAVLHKPYDPHGTMRRLGIPNTPPLPPIFRSTHPPLLSSEAGQDNPAYDMSPSAEVQAGDGGVQFYTSGGGELHLTTRPLPVPGGPSWRGANLEVELHHSPSAEQQVSCAGDYSDCGSAGRLPGLHHQHQKQQLQLQQQRQQRSIPSCVPVPTEAEDNFHSRLDSGLSEPACESPGVASACGEGEGAGSRDRPQSQTSHSSHSTDSEDSGFRSSRSGPLSRNAGTSSAQPPSFFKRSRSAGRVMTEGRQQAAESSLPNSNAQSSILLTPTALWPHPYPQHYPYPSVSSPAHRYSTAAGSQHSVPATISTHSHHSPISTAPQLLSDSHYHHQHYHLRHHHHHHHVPVSTILLSQNDPNHHHHNHTPTVAQCSPAYQSGACGELYAETGEPAGTSSGEMRLGWKYLQDVAAPSKRQCASLGSRGPLHSLTCHHQSMTLAQVQASPDRDRPDAFGFSVV